jgi:alcohol dehydrogenase class IV
MAEALGVGDARTPEAAAEAVGDALAVTYRGVEMPSRVRDLGIPEAELPLLAADTLKNFNANRGARPDDQVERMLALLRAAW